ncbi:MAG: hypothetical protein ACREVK_05440 [Gammaproteobacteria bacterium]
MSGLLDGKIALISGVSGDGQIRQMVAQAFAREGAALGIVARSRQ